MAETHQRFKNFKLRRAGSDRQRLGLQPHTQGQTVFLLVRDGSGFVQCVAFKGDLDEESSTSSPASHRSHRSSSRAPSVKISAHPVSPADMNSA
jgi:hypothetical protein